jgi:chromosomal replication initiation ATPase DnaA
MKNGRNPAITVKVKLSLQDIAEVVASYHGITVEFMKQPSNQRKIVLPRQQATYAMRSKGYWLEPIADFFHQHHATTINSLKSVQNSMDTDPEYRKQIDDILCNLSKSKHDTTATN